MTKKGFDCLYSRLISQKCVLVYNFNIEDFKDYCFERGTILHGGALEMNAGIPYAQHMYID